MKTWKQITTVECMGAPVVLKAALADFFEEELEHPSGRQFNVEIHAGRAVIRHVQSVTIDSVSVKRGRRSA